MKKKWMTLFYGVVALMMICFRIIPMCQQPLRRGELKTVTPVLGNEIHHTLF